MNCIDAQKVCLTDVEIHNCSLGVSANEKIVAAALDAHGHTIAINAPSGNVRLSDLMLHGNGTDIDAEKVIVRDTTILGNDVGVPSCKLVKFVASSLDNSD
ncbi:MAG: hypothetical protein P8R42_03750 [Candidatus Binatia bacterium]|nr:hypothetical protein [Candidatus Binatia bacterium]